MNCDLVLIGPDGKRWRFKCRRCGSECRSPLADPAKVHRSCGDHRPIDDGPGSELKAIIAELGLAGDAGCGCEAMARQMNVWGVCGCREHHAQIVAQLRKAAAKKGWLAKLAAAKAAVAAGLALRIDWLDPAPSLVEIAIERAMERAAGREAEPAQSAPAPGTRRGPSPG